MKRRIFAIATDSAGCYLYRLHWPLTHLDPDEFDVVIGGPPVELIEREPGDVVVGQRIAGDNPTWLAMCADPRILAVYEIDDDIIDVDPANQVPYSIFQPQREGTIRNIAAADVVTCSTPILAAKVAQWNPRTRVLPNCLPEEWYGPVREPSRDGPVVIGWAGSMFHAQDWAEVGPQLARFAASESRAQFVTIGADYLSPFVKVYHSYGWGSMDAYRDALSVLDIGLAPLSFTQFNRSKSHAKVLEYGARGIPAVASRWGEYASFIEGGERPGGYLALTAASFTSVLRRLMDDEQRAIYSEEARRRAEEFRIVNNVWRWAEVYRQTAEEARA